MEGGAVTFIRQNQVSLSNLIPGPSSVAISRHGARESWARENRVGSKVQVEGVLASLQMRVLLYHSDVRFKHWKSLLAS